MPLQELTHSESQSYFDALAKSVIGKAKGLSAQFTSNALPPQPGVTGTPPAPSGQAPASAPVQPAQAPAVGGNQPPAQVPYERLQDVSHKNAELHQALAAEKQAREEMASRLAAQEAAVAEMRAAMAKANGRDEVEPVAEQAERRPDADAQSTLERAIAKQTAPLQRELESFRMHRQVDAEVPSLTPQQRDAVVKVMSEYRGLSPQEAMGLARGRTPAAWPTVAPVHHQEKPGGTTAPANDQEARTRDLDTLRNPFANPVDRRVATERQFTSLAARIVNAARTR